MIAMGIRIAGRACMNRVLIALSCLGLAACSGDGNAPPADPQAARAEIDSLLPPLVDDTADSLDGADATSGMQGLRASMTSMNASFEGLPFQFPLAEEGTAV